EPAVLGQACDARPRGRLLGYHHDAGVVAVGRRVRLLKERDRLKVLPTAVDVRAPLAILPRVVEVEEGGDSVDADAVDVELIEPVEGVRNEEVADLVAAVVEDVGAPVGM